MKSLIFINLHFDIIKYLENYGPGSSKFDFRSQRIVNKILCNHEQRRHGAYGITLIKGKNDREKKNLKDDCKWLAEQRLGEIMKRRNMLGPRKEIKSEETWSHT